MKIHAFILTWNEQDIIGLVIKHYQKFCDKITIYDNHSIDHTATIAKDLGCEVIPFGTKFFDDAENMKVKNECWKGCDADWVIVCDADEVLLPWVNLENGGYRRVESFNHITIFKTQGWQIMSEQMPQHDLLEITTGYKFNNYSKNIIFSPKHITDINYNPGAHKCNPMGKVVWSDETLYVLHYKHIGGVERTIKRYKEYSKRMSKNNRKNGWGIHYNQTPARLRQEWEERMSKSKALI